MTFDEWYATYQADPATDGRPEPTARAAYEAGAQSRDELLSNEPHRHRADFPLEGEYCCICDIRATLREELAEAKARHAEELTTFVYREDALRSELAEAKAGAQTARHSALVDAVAEATRAGIAGSGCDCNFAPCEHDQVRIRIVSAIAQLAAALKETKP